MCIKNLRHGVLFGTLKKFFFLLLLLLIINQPVFSVYSEPGRSNQPQPENLPLVFTKSTVHKENPHLALIVSGDGGWYKFEQAIADSLALLGIPTIGLDVKKYLRDRVEPEKAADDISWALKHYGSEWGKNRIVLIGYSLGAEILPFIISRMPEIVKSEISIYVLLSPTLTTDFEVHLTDMLGIGNRHNTFKVVDELTKIKKVPGLCIFGSDENPETARIFKNNVNISIIPGNHHYNFNTSLIVRTIRKYGYF